MFYDINCMIKYHSYLSLDTISQQIGKFQVCPVMSKVQTYSMLPPFLHITILLGIYPPSVQKRSKYINQLYSILYILYNFVSHIRQILKVSILPVWLRQVKSIESPLNSRWRTSFCNALEGDRRARLEGMCDESVCELRRIGWWW